MVVDPVDTPLGNCPKRLNDVGVLAVALGELNLLVDNDADEILRVFLTPLVDDIVTATSVNHNISAFLASMVQHLQEFLSRQFCTIGVPGSNHTMNMTAAPFLDHDNGSLRR